MINILQNDLLTRISVCKSCIYKFIAKSDDSRPGCPICKVSLGPRPYEAVKYVLLLNISLKFFILIASKERTEY